MNKPKQKAIEEARKNFVDDVNRIGYWLQDVCGDLKDKRFNNEYDFLYYKSFVLSNLLMRLPLGLDHCPFCIGNLVYDDVGDKLPDCSKCPYAAMHGVCQEENSIYKILSNSLKLVRQILVNLYATEKPTQEDIATIRSLVEGISSQLDYWEYRNLLAKKDKDWREVLKGRED